MIEGLWYVGHKGFVCFNSAFRRSFTIVVLPRKHAMHSHDALVACIEQKETQGVVP